MWVRHRRERGQQFTPDIQFYLTFTPDDQSTIQYNWLCLLKIKVLAGVVMWPCVALDQPKLGIISRTAYTSLTKLLSTFICYRNLKLPTFVYPKLIPLICAAYDGHKRKEKARRTGSRGESEIPFA